MNRLYFVTLGLIALLVSGACSSAADQSSSASANGVNGPNADSTVAKSGDPMAPPQPIDANTMNNTSSGPLDSPMANRMQGKMDAMRKSGGENIDYQKVMELAQKSARPAPDNSTFTSYLTDAGYEVRTFVNHPQVLKVEKRIDTNSQTVKVFLRGGRVVTLSGDKIPTLSTVGVDAILVAAGVPKDPPRQSAEPTAGAQTKKPGN